MNDNDAILLHRAVSRTFTRLSSRSIFTDFCGLFGLGILAELSCGLWRHLGVEDLVVRLGHLVDFEQLPGVVDRQSFCSGTLIESHYFSSLFAIGHFFVEETQRPQRTTAPFLIIYLSTDPKMPSSLQLLKRIITAVRQSF